MTLASRSLVKILRVGQLGVERTAVLVDSDRAVVVDDVVGADVVDWVADPDLRGDLEAVVERRCSRGAAISLVGQRIGPPIPRPHQILCIGLNYADHARETGSPTPTEPIVFTKAPNTLVGPHDDVVLPPGSRATDWEVELGVVIGRHASHLANEQEAQASIAGYVLVNDVSERDFQLNRGGQWVKGKSAETFNPCGPFLVTPDEVGDVTSLSMWLEVNGARRQDGTTSDMIFQPSFLVRYLSQFMALEPGDLINTGTPAGVGMGSTPPVYLVDGDTMELGIDGLGTQRQRVRAHRADHVGHQGARG